LQAGNDHLTNAIETQKKNRQKMMALVLIGSIIMIVLVLALLGFFSWFFCTNLQLCGNS